jgi:ligand-binding sensor domain-containing protein
LALDRPKWFFKYDFDTKSYTNFANRELKGDATGTDVSTLFMDTNGTLWVGTRYNGLYLLQNGVLRKIALSIPSTSIESIIETSGGFIWVATFENGILKWINREKSLISIRPPIKTLKLGNSHLLYDKTKEQIWASTRDMGVLLLQIQTTGLKLLQKFSFEATNPNSLSVNFAWQKVQDPSGPIWVGTIGGGLNKIESLKMVNTWSDASIFQNQMLKVFCKINKEISGLEALGWEDIVQNQDNGYIMT